MNKIQLANAYAELVQRYDLKSRQRDNLDRSEDYTELMKLVHDKAWARVDTLMQANNYFNPGNADDPKFELVD